METFSTDVVAVGGRVTVVIIGGAIVMVIGGAMVVVIGGGVVAVYVVVVLIGEGSVTLIRHPRFRWEAHCMHV